jgi:FG-GAP repeat protein
VGAWSADPAGNSHAGESYVVFGKADGTAVNLSDVTAGSGGFVINGIDPDDESGISVSGAGDVNGDGLADVIVGAHYADPAGHSDAGESYVVFGKADGTAVNLSDVTAGSGGFVINGIDPDDESGISVSGAGDVNGDGLADVIVGATRADPAGNSNAGESYVVFSPVLRGDLDGDGLVEHADFQLLLDAWGPCLQACPPFCLGDLDGDCRVGIVDFLLLLGNWRT